MYMDRVGTSADGYVSSEFAQARILITGLTAGAGVDVARSFAEHKARLIVHTTELSPELIELVAVLTQSADEIRLHTHDISHGRCRRELCADFGAGLWRARCGHQHGVDFARRDRSRSTRRRSRCARHGEARAAGATDAHRRQSHAAHPERRAHPERLRRCRARETARETAIAGYVRTALAAMTAKEARAWAAKGIRINAVGPHVIEDIDRSTGALSDERARRCDAGSLSRFAQRPIAVGPCLRCATASAC